jgi:hypothetical protein
MARIYDEHIVYNVLNDMKTDNVAAIATIGYKSDVTLKESCKDVMLIFAPDGKNIVKIMMPSINIFKGFINEIKFEGKRKCDICYNKEFKKLWVCSNCSKRTCPTCFPKLSNKMVCSYCRYTLREHMDKQIDYYKIRPLIVETKIKSKYNLTH